MNRQAVLIAIVIFAILAGLVAIVARRQGGPEQTVDAATEPGGVVASPSGEDTAASEVLAADLYFPGTGGRLLAERREVPESAEPTERISAVVETLLAGPSGSGLHAPLPDGVSVRKVYLVESGLALLDLESPESAPPPASGSLGEMLTVYSLVNTVLLNFEELDRVVLLWNGRQLKTFAGHLDTMRPLAANTDLIAQAR